ncbi:MAG: metal-dependent hydrolase [Nitrospinota bacterium]|nr:MAG: metal-dependent hydrolase [Nitrospinota bacterium]
MALPIAHWSVVAGLLDGHSRKALVLAACLSILPDFDFLLVWGLGWPVSSYHRTFSHSLAFAALITMAYTLVTASQRRLLSPWACFVAVSSHPLLDLLCTANAADHGIMVFWPLSRERLGWPVLVPLYRLLAPSPFSLTGALRFTLLEVLISPLLWGTGLAVQKVLRRLSLGLAIPASQQKESSPGDPPERQEVL